MENNQEYFVPMSRLKRERRKWMGKINEGATVFVIHSKKEPYQIILLDKEKFNKFSESVY